MVKGPQIMLGYSNNEQANKETFDGAGWLRSGDTGYYDEDGFLYLVDRIKELIKVKGLQVIIFPPSIASIPGVSKRLVNFSGL